MKWIVRSKLIPNPRIRLLCFAHAGVGASAFRGWAERADPEIEICSVQLPGRESRARERAFTRMEALIPPLTEGLRELLDRPYVIYGHSVGGWIAFEAVRAFRQAGLSSPLHFFVGASPAPQLPWAHPLMHGLNEDDFLSEIQTRYGGVPSQVLDDPELRAIFVPGLRADVTIMETYRYRPESPLDCGITALAGQRDRIATPSKLCEWRDQTNGTFRSETMDGDHFFTQSARDRLLEIINVTVGELLPAAAFGPPK